MAKFAFFCDYDARVKNDILFNVEQKDVYVELAKELRSDGHDVHTLDVYQQNGVDPDVCLFLDVPRSDTGKIINQKRTVAAVVIREGKVILPVNYSGTRLPEFRKIITWDADLLRRSNAAYFPSARYIREDRVLPVKFEDRKFCCNISRKLTSTEVGELYSERLRAIKWFESNYPDQFDLYGYGWDQGIVKLFGKSLYKSNLFFEHRPSYKGSLEEKYATLSKYKFSICFENTSNMRNYISEKIFDCFLAQTIPIYYGATNVQDLIPTECFIDFRKFASYEELYFFINGMSKKKFLTYLDAINNYIDSPMGYNFSFENWVSTIKNQIISLID
jgi:hypothetical protein